MNELKIGQRVYWNDPDNNECSGEYTVLAIPVQDNENRIILVGNGYSESEVFENELTIIEDIGTNFIKIDEKQALELYEQDCEIYIVRGDGSEALIEDENDLHAALYRHDCLAVEETEFKLTILIQSKHFTEILEVAEMLSFVCMDTEDKPERYTVLKLLYAVKDVRKFGRDAYEFGLILQTRFHVHDHLDLQETL